MLAAGGGDNAVYVLREGAGGALGLHAVIGEAHTKCDVNSVAFHPKDARMLATAGDDETVKIWHIGA